MTSPITWRRVRRVTVALGFIAVATLAGVSWFVAGDLVASANHEVGPPPAGSGLEPVTIRSQAGSRLAAWYAPRAGATATVILLHPIRADRRAMLGRARLLHEAGHATLLVDLQAHGESPGEVITAGYRERLDVHAALDFVRTTNPAHRVGVIGWSLGGAASLLAAPLNIDALVLESVYPTFREAVHNRIAMRLGVLSHILTPALLVQMKPRLGISPSQLRPIDHLHRVGCPVLIAAGDRDAHTTLAQARRLHDAAVDPKELVIFDGAAHTDLLAYDPGKYNRIIAFLNTHLAVQEPPVRP